MKLLVALSGGLDSAATVLLLKKEGFDVNNIEALFIDMDGRADKIEKAHQVAKLLGVRLQVADCRIEFKESVIEYFFRELKSGRTPTPCAYCNANFKFKILFEWAKRLHCDKVVTGHYVQVYKSNQHLYIKRGVDDNKDQSYFLWQLSEDQVNRIIFPLGGFKKSEIKDFLIGEGFEYISKIKESMSLCFIPNGVGYSEFVSQRLSPMDGAVLDTSGRVIGKHRGICFYTIGQKRGFDLYDKDSVAEIVKIDSKANTLIASYNSGDLYCNEIRVRACRIVDEDEFFNSDRLKVVVRGLGRNPNGFCVVERNNDELIVKSDSPFWAVASGQSAVFYIDDRVIGGGVII